MSASDYSSWFEKKYPDLSGYGLWLRGGEVNTIPATEFDKRNFRLLITRLSTWRDTAESFTHTLLYQIAANVDGVFPDLAYLPPPKDAEVFDRDNIPWLLGTTSKHGGRDFGMIAFSDSIVQELVNVPLMLGKSDIPVGKQARMADNGAPLVILGGASALYAVGVFSESDSPVDGIFIGEDARLIGRIFRECAAGRSRGVPKQEILEGLAEIDGFVLPERRPKTVVYQAEPLPPEQLLADAPVLNNEESLGRGNLQLSEGCACFCSFCAESFSRKPYREFGAEQLLAAALRQKALRGVDDLELYSFNFNMHRDFYRIIADLAPRFASIGLKSQRFDSIAHDADLLAVLHAAEKSSITCGLEGISPRLRRYLHKSLRESDLDKSLSRLLAAPLRELKIFLVATGIECEEDYEELKKLLAGMQTTLRAANRHPRVIFSATILVRFPWTPLEFEDAPDPRVCAAVVRRTEQIVRAAGFEFRASSEPADYWLSQALVRAADPRIGRALLAAQRETGFVYYREVPISFTDAVKRAALDVGISPESLLAGSPPAERMTKPWQGIATGVDERFLVSQWEAARAFRDEGFCGGSAAREGSCMGCDACGSAETKAAITARPAARKFTAEKFRTLLRAKKEQTIPVAFQMSISERLRGLPRKAAGVALARALMLADERLVEPYRGFGGAWTFDTWGTPWLTGDEVITLRWDNGARELLTTIMHDAGFLIKVNRELDGWGKCKGLAESAAVPLGTFSVTSPFPFDPSDYFQKKALKHTRIKRPDGGIGYEMSKESLKKKVLLSCVATVQTGGITTVTVVPGPKFSPEEFAKTAFMLPSPQEWVRVEMAYNW
jgi:radical SAM superfamily enzyme YgiQ (UPF0313 family)